MFHLYKFDKFKCLKLNNGPYAGAFKRLMTVSGTTAPNETCTVLTAACSTRTC